MYLEKMVTTMGELVNKSLGINRGPSLRKWRSQKSHYWISMRPWIKFPKSQEEETSRLSSLMQTPSKSWLTREMTLYMYA